MDIKEEVLTSSLLVSFCLFLSIHYQTYICMCQLSNNCKPTNGEFPCLPAPRPLGKHHIYTKNNLKRAFWPMVPDLANGV